MSSGGRDPHRIDTPLVDERAVVSLAAKLGSPVPMPTRLTSIQPELWIEEARTAVAFYEAAFGATTLHLVGEDENIVAQLAVGEAAFWVATASSATGRFDPRAIDGATGRTLLVVDDPEAFVRRAVEAGAVETSPVATEHGWLLGRLTDPFGHEWEIGKPVGPWPPREADPLGPRT